MVAANYIVVMDGKENVKAGFTKECPEADGLGDRGEALASSGPRTIVLPGALDSRNPTLEIARFADHFCARKSADASLEV
jgi:hypothetical protein